MAAGAVYSSAGYNFGSLESIRRQAKEIGDRVQRQSDARKKEQEETGLIKNRDGDMVEISSLTDKQVDELNHYHDLQLVSPQEAMIGFMATDPHAEEVEESKRLGAKCAKIQDKMLAGQKLQPEEKSFLREHYSELLSKAVQMEMEAEQLEKRLRSCKSNDDAQQIYLEAKMNAVSQFTKEDNSAMFIIAALDETFNRHMGRGNSHTTFDFSQDKKLDVYA